VDNGKVNGIIGGTGFILSLLVGIISGYTVLTVLVRACACGVGFFVLAWGAHALVRRFLPELLTQEVADSEQDETGPGAQVDITVEDEAEQAVPSGLFTSDADAAGLDQHHENGYTQKGAVDEHGLAAGFVPLSPAMAVQPAVSDSVHGHAMETFLGLESLESAAPPVDSMADQEVVKKTPGTGKSPDFKKVDPKVMASAIQTILKR
jgi:hypothetical protein